LVLYDDKYRFLAIKCPTNLNNLISNIFRRIRKNKEVKTIRRKAKGQEKKIRKEKEKERKLDDNTFCS